MWKASNGSIGRARLGGLSTRFTCIILLQFLLNLELNISHCQNSQHWLKKNHLILAVSALTILTQAANLETSFQSAQSNPSHGRLLATCSFASGEPRKCCKAVCTSQWIFSVSECIVHIRIAVTQGLIYYSKVMRKLNNEKYEHIPVILCMSRNQMQHVETWLHTQEQNGRKYPHYFLRVSKILQIWATT